jgi:hypothetical protein
MKRSKRREKYQKDMKNSIRDERSAVKKLTVNQE